MENYIPIEPITFGLTNQHQANAIVWQVNGLKRNATTATAVCSLVNITDGTFNRAMPEGMFRVHIDNTTLQAWGADDSVIDNVVLAYSPLFVLREEE